MEDRKRPAERELRDYPISLRQSARAVFGSAYDHAERCAPDVKSVHDAPPRP